MLETADKPCRPSAAQTVFLPRYDGTLSPHHKPQNSGSVASAGSMNQNGGQGLPREEARHADVAAGDKRIRPASAT